jgi:hypothetical protein
MVPAPSEHHRTVALDLNEAEAEVRQRWFVWTAAGLVVGPITWIDQEEAGPAAGESGVAAPRSMGLHVSRPGAHADVVLHPDGWAEVAVLRPGADAVVHCTAQVETVAAFATLVDRAVELITWSGAPKDDSPTPRRALRPERGDR